MADRTVSVRLQAQVTDYMAKFSAAGKATTDLANKIDAAKGKAARGYQNIGRGAMVAGGLIVAGFGLALHEMADFEAKMALVATLSHANTAEMMQLRTAALHVGQAYGFTAMQVGDAEAELIKAGVGVKDILGGALTGALTLAAAGQTDVAAATETAAIAMTQFKLSGSAVPHIADLLAAGADKALGSVADLSEGLQSGGLSAAQMGLTVDDTVATLAEFAQSGLLAEKGGTVLRQMFIKLAAPSAAASVELEKLGVSVFDASGKFIGMSKLAGELHDKFGPLTQAERNHALAVIFGARAIQGANILVADGAKGWNEWSKKVNDSGFAALQAAGKLNSLSGDVTKLKAALQAAFIGVGEGGSGPLRTLAQDGTKVVEAWNGMPAPVRAGSEALIAFAGATLLAGGAAIVLIPKVRATQVALRDMGTSASAIAGRLARGGLIVGGALAAAAAFQAIDVAATGARINTDALTGSLEDFATTNVVTGELTKAFGSNLQDLKSTLDLAGKTGLDVFGIRLHSLADTFTHTGADFKNARDKVAAVDEALSSLASNGHADQAAQAFQQLSAAAQSQGISVDKLAQLFPQYQAALGLAAAQQDGMTGATARLGTALGGQADSLKTAADAAKNYNDTLHAMVDPVFGLAKALGDVKTAQDKANDAGAGAKSKDALAAHKQLVDAERAYARVTHEKKPNADAVAAALSRVRDAQAAYTQAVKAHLPRSAAAKQANIDLASASLDVTTAAAVLSAALKDGTTSAQQMGDQLRKWVEQGLLTKRQADDVAKSLGIVIGKANKLDGSNVTVKVHADVKGALAGLDAVHRAAVKLAGLLGPLGGFTPTTGVGGGLGGLLGAAIPQPKFQASSTTHVTVKPFSVPQANTNTTNINVAGNIDTKALDAIRRRQRLARATL